MNNYSLSSPVNQDSYSKVIALEESNTLRSRLSAAEWSVLTKIKLMGNVGEDDLFLLGGLSHDSLLNIDLADAIFTEIPSKCFLESIALKSILLPDCLLTISDDAFCSCSLMDSLVIPCSVKSIGNRAFLGCTVLNKVQLPRSLHKIGEKAFSNCFNLSNISFNSIKSPFVSENSFSSVPNTCSFCIPKGSYPSYNRTPYSFFSLNEF